MLVVTPISTSGFSGTVATPIRSRISLDLPSLQVAYWYYSRSLLVSVYPAWESPWV